MKSKPQDSSKKVLAITAAITAVASIWFLWPQLMVLVLSALMAFLFYPLYLRLKRKKGFVAASATLVASFLVVLIPLAIILISAVGQLIGLAEYASRSISLEQIPEFGHIVINGVNEFMAGITGVRPSVTEQGVVSFLKDTLPGVARATIDILFGVLANIPQLGVALLIYVFAFMEFTLNGPNLINKLRKISPFSLDDTDRYLERVGSMANAMVKGQLMISMLISLISALLLIPLGYGHYFFIFFILFTILNFIPLGCGLVLLPLAIYSMFTGQFWMGLVVIILYYLAGYLDPILRPRFVPDNIKLSTAWMIVATFCGIAYFGILGVIYGPIIMIVIVTTWEFYIRSKSGSDVMKPAKAK